MTVSSQTSTATFVGNGVATAFPLPFRFFDNGDIRAYFIDSTTGAATAMAIGVDYTLMGAGEPEVDGNALSLLTTTAPLASMRGLYVERFMPQTQSTDLVNQGEFFASTHEDVFDRLTMLIQQQVTETNKAKAEADEALAIAQEMVARQEAFEKNYTYVDLGPYAAGLNFTSRNQVFSYMGEFYSPGPSITLPYTTTGAGAGEIANFRSVGDAVLRADLADASDPLLGAGMVARASVVAQSISDLLLAKQDASQAVAVIGYHAGSKIGGGLFVWDAARAKTAHNGGTIISPTVPWAGTLATLPAFLLGTGETTPAGAGCWVQVYDTLRVTMFGAVGGTPSGAVTANDAAIQAAINAASVASSGVSITDVIVDQNTVFLVGGTYLGTNKSVFQPKSYVRLTGGGTIKVQNGANTAAGATGWNLIYPKENTDAAVVSFEVIGVNFYGNGANNANTIMKRNAMVGVLTGSKIRVSGCRFVNCPGFHVITIGRDIFPQTVDDVYLTHNEVLNVAEAIPGNTGITDHSSFYMLSTDSHADNNRFITSTASMVASCVEVHGNNSSANENFYTGFLNLANIGGYINSTSGISIRDNVGRFVQMLVRAYSKASFVTDNVVIRGNELIVSTTSLCQIDFGGAQVENLLFGSITIQDNVIRYAGSDTFYPPPSVWLRGVTKAVVKGNTFREGFGWSVLVSASATNGVISITDNVFDNPNRTATVSYASAVYIDAISNPFKSLEFCRNTVRAARQFALQAAGNAVGGVIKFMGNTVTETTDLVFIPSTSSITRVDLQHYGDVPATGQYSTGYTKFSMGSTIVDSANNKKWTMKQLPSGGVFNSESYGTAAPVSGQRFNGDIVWNYSPAAGGAAGFICVTTGTPGTWKNFAAISA